MDEVLSSNTRGGAEVFDSRTRGLLFIPANRSPSNTQRIVLFGGGDRGYQASKRDGNRHVSRWDLVFALPPCSCRRSHYQCGYVSREPWRCAKVDLSLFRQQEPAPARDSWRLPRGKYTVQDHRETWGSKARFYLYRWGS